MRRLSGGQNAVLLQSDEQYSERQLATNWITICTSARLPVCVSLEVGFMRVRPQPKVPEVKAPPVTTSGAAAGSQAQYELPRHGHPQAGLVRQVINARMLARAVVVGLRSLVAPPPVLLVVVVEPSACLTVPPGTSTNIGDHHQHESGCGRRASSIPVGTRAAGSRGGLFC
jgi:hypothetical protein